MLGSERDRFKFSRYTDCGVHMVIVRVDRNYTNICVHEP